jgi:iron(III) transport system permease protein
MLGNAQVGTINLAWRWLTGADGTLVDVYSYGGIVWHMMQYSTPFIFLFVVDAFRAMDPSLEESSRHVGAHALADLLAHHLRLMLPITTSPFLLSFIRGMEAFESAVFFGTPVGIKVLTTQIFDMITQRAQPDYQGATAMGFATMALMFLLLVVQSRILRGRSFTTSPARPMRPTSPGSAGCAGSPSRSA